MFILDITVSVLPLAGLVVLAFFSGFFLRSAQLKSAHRKVIELEKEMLSNHADILDLQKQKADLLRQMKESKIPVIPMKLTKDDSDKTRQAN